MKDKINTIIFLGFISIDNAFLNMRRLCDSGKVYESIDKRYINYKIFDKFDTSERFYTIPTAIDTLCPNRIKIHIAEGPFDILSILYNLNNGILKNNIYGACTGSGYMGLLRFILLNMKICDSKK